MTSPLSDAQGPPAWRLRREGRKEEGEGEEGRLSWPLSSYFVSSSHNTYLTGNQLYSAASGDAYRNVGGFFLRPVRGVFTGGECNDRDYVG